MAWRATYFSYDGPLGTGPRPMQMFDLIEDSVAVAPVEPAAPRKIVKVIELLIGIPRDQLNGESAFIRQNRIAINISEMPEQKIPALNRYRCGRTCFSRCNLKDHKASTGRIMEARKAGHRGLHT